MFDSLGTSGLFDFGQYRDWIAEYEICQKRLSLPGVKKGEVSERKFFRYFGKKFC